jgi:hypothetical protein
MPSRKTVDVQFLKDKVNHYLAHSPNAHVGERDGNIMLLEMVLSETGNYHGFNYIGGYREGMDETRRFYY